MENYAFVIGRNKKTHTIVRVLLHGLVLYFQCQTESIVYIRLWHGLYNSDMAVRPSDDIGLMRAKVCTPDELDRLVALAAGMMKMSADFREQDGQAIALELRDMVAARVALPPGYRAMCALVDRQGVVLWTDAYALACAADTDTDVGITAKVSYSIRTSPYGHGRGIYVNDPKRENRLFSINTVENKAVKGPWIAVSIDSSDAYTHSKLLNVLTAVVITHVRHTPIRCRTSVEVHVERTCMWLQTLDHCVDVECIGNEITFQYNHTKCTASFSHSMISESQVLVRFTIVETTVNAKISAILTDRDIDMTCRLLITRVAEVVCDPMVDVLRRVLDDDDPTKPYALFDVDREVTYSISPSYSLFVYKGEMWFHSTTAEPDDRRDYILKQQSGADAVNHMFYTVYTKLRNDDIIDDAAIAEYANSHTTE